ncbi:hypothetical protein Hanom_Chr14g01293401 [Helianthus anomalus]
MVCTMCIMSFIGCCVLCLYIICRFLLCVFIFVGFYKPHLFIFSHLQFLTHLSTHRSFISTLFPATVSFLWRGFTRGKQRERRVWSVYGGSSRLRWRRKVIMMTWPSSEPRWLRLCCF